jgi:phospholipase D1/2
MRMPEADHTPRVSQVKNNIQRARPAWLKIIVLLVVFFALFLSWRYTPLAQVITGERILQAARKMARVWWAPAAVIAIYTPAAFLMFPRPLITMFAALAFGPWRGFAVSMIGILGSALATYGVGRCLSEQTVRRIAGKRLAKTSAAIRRRGFISVLAVTVAPVAPFPIVGMVAGAVRIRVGHYMLGTSLGMMPGTLATTVFANQIEVALEDPDRIDYWVVVGVLVLLLSLTFAARRWIMSVQQEA